MKIAIQGIKGSFHHIVANKYFGNVIDLVECMSFTEIPLLLENNGVDSAVMAIENSIAGAILPNYALIDEYNLSIEGEYFTNIHHHLMALDGQELEDIKEVWSHPMALLQCRKFFRERPEIKLIEETFEKEIRPMLKADGGDIELIDVEGDRVLVSLRGMCSSCSSSSFTLKKYIEPKLKEFVSPDLYIEEVKP